MKKISWKPLLIAAVVMFPAYLLSGMIAPTPFWWAVSLLIWTGCGAYILAGKVNAAPCLHALLAGASHSRRASPHRITGAFARCVPSGAAALDELFEMARRVLAGGQM